MKTNMIGRLVKRLHLTGMVFLLLGVMTPMGATAMDTSQVVGAEGTLMDEGCTSFGDDAPSGVELEPLGETEWTVSPAPQGGNMASKEVKVGFRSVERKVIDPKEAPGDPGASLQDCSAGECTVIVHVYENTTVSVKAHAGLFGFLPWGYAKAQVDQKVSVETESEIHCEGEAFVVLTADGGIGPRSVTASFWKDQFSQVVHTCQYDNILDKDCTITFAEDFEVQARTPGKYTRFDVINGGRIRNDSIVSVALGPTAVMETPEVDVDVTPNENVHANAIALGQAGEWRTKYQGIAISVDTEEAVQALQDASDLL